MNQFCVDEWKKERLTRLTIQSARKKERVISVLEKSTTTTTTSQSFGTDTVEVFISQMLEFASQSTADDRSDDRRD